LGCKANLNFYNKLIKYLLKNISSHNLMSQLSIKKNTKPREISIDKIMRSLSLTSFHVYDKF